MKYAVCVAEDSHLGIGYIISHLKNQGHDVKLFFDPRQYARGYSNNGFLAKIFSLENYNIRKMKKYKPDVCLFTCITADYQWALKIAKRVKKEIGCKVIFGGVHSTLMPEEVKKNEFIDEVIVGDGISYFGGTFDPDNLFPDRVIFYKELPKTHRTHPIFMSSFGCPFNCSFCGNEQLRKVKQRGFVKFK